MSTNQIQVFFIVILMMFSTLSVLSQNMEPSYLQSLEDESLLLLYDQHYGDSIVLERIARTYLDRAREEKDTIKMARGYDRLARIFHPEKNIAYADSLIALTKDIEHVTYPAQGYIIKGHEYAYFDFTKSTQNYYTAYQYAEKYNNLSQQLYLLNVLIVRKSYWGNAEEALLLQKASHKIIQQKTFRNQMLKNSRPGFENRIEDLITEMEFNSLAAYVICYLNAEKVDSARIYLNKAIKLKQDYKGLYEEYFDFYLSTIQNEVYFNSQNYLKTIEMSNKILDHPDLGNQFEAIYDAYMFKGISLIRIGNEKQGLTNLLLADSIYNIHKFDLLPYRRQTTVELLSYSQLNNDVNKQIQFHKKIAYIDSILKINYSFYEKSLQDEIITPKLMAEKDAIIDELYKETLEPDPKFYIILGALTVSLCFLFYYFRKRLVYKRRLEALLAKTINTENKKIAQNSAYKKEIAKEIAEDILIKLEVFEQKHQFVKSDVNLISLAKKFKTNPNYLSRVINLKLEKNFSQYLHDLRINYALEQVLSNPYYHKYTIKAIAEECGYNSAGSFSRAFYKKTGIYPSYYIEKMSAKNSN